MKQVTGHERTSIFYTIMKSGTGCKMRLLLISFIFSCFPFPDVEAQRGLREIIYTDSTAIIFQNNYIRNANNVKYQPYDIKMPFRDLYFDVYGSRLKIAAHNLAELMKNGGYFASGSYRVADKQDAVLFSFDNLEYNTIVNGTIKSGWQPASRTTYIDTITSKYHNKPGETYYLHGYLLYDGNLDNRDSLTLLLRKGNDKPFLTIHFKKRSALESPPRLMVSMDRHDKDLSTEKFIQKALEGFQSVDNTFYDDWPGESNGGNTKLFPETKTAYYFHPRGRTQNDSTFEYRLVINGDHPAAWKKSDNIIFVTGLQAGRQYTLQVRDTDKPQYIFSKRFYVPGYWYQTLWFKAGIGLLVLLTGTVIFFFFRSRKQKRNKEEQQSKMRALYTQLNPHFIFNALGSIQGLLNEGQVETANKYLSGFGNLLRSTLDNGGKNTITLAEELQHLSTYISLEQLRRPFVYTQNVEEGIHPSQVDMLPLFFQPAIENAIKHGYRGSGHILNLTFSVSKKTHDLKVDIHDNGKGFNAAADHKGKGLKLTMERVNLYNRISKNKKIRMHISSDDNGTLVSIEFINWLDHD